MTSVTLFFSYGVSIKTWHQSGFLSRECSYYRALQEKGVAIQFLTYGDKSDYEFADILGDIKIVPIYDTLRKSNFKTINFIKSLMIPFIFKKDLSSSDIFKTNQIWGSWVAVIAKFLLQRPLFVRAGFDLYKNSLLEKTSKIKLVFIYFVSKLAYKSADFVWVPTKEISRFVECKHKIRSDKVMVFPNWIDTDLFLDGLADNVFTDRVLYIGRLSPEKNVPLLISAISQTNLKIDIVGEGRLKQQLIKQAKHSNVEIRFLGRVPNVDLPRLINQYPILVLCSNFEGSPKVLLEAMACGISVIGTNKPGIRNVITHNKNGLLCESDTVSLRKAIKLLHQNKAKRQQLGQEARKKIILENSKIKALSKEVSIYKTLLGNERR